MWAGLNRFKPSTDFKLDNVRGLCKTWTLDWTGLWTGLDWPKQLYTYTKATTACPQPYLKLLPCCWIPESSSSRFPRGQRSRAHLISFNKGGSGWLLVGFLMFWTSMTVSYGCHMHLVALAVCIQLFWSVQSSPVHSPVQSRVQVLQRPQRKD